MLNLKRPLVVFDLETTGPDVEEDRIVEIACIKIDPLSAGQYICKRKVLNPGVNIPDHIAAIHGITNERVEECPTFLSVASEFYDYFLGCDLAGYNAARFDSPLLTSEFRRSGIKWPALDTRVIDVFSIAMMQEKRNLTWAAKFYGGLELENAHTAEADTQATFAVLMGQVEMYDAHDLDALDALQRDPTWVDSDGKFKRQGETIVITFGKHSGKEIKKIPSNYLRWMAGGSFKEDTKQLIREHLSNV